MSPSENENDRFMRELYNELKDKLAAEISILPDKPEETPENILLALWHTSVGNPKSAELAATADLIELNEQNVSTLRALVDKRLSGVPLAHLTGRQCFMGIEMLAGPQALVPRKETELLGRAALNIASQIYKDQGHVTVVDVCTGSGNLALSVARYVTGARVFGADISSEAIELACRNSQFLGLDHNTEFRVGDLLTPFNEPDFINQVDLIICNPPYIQSSKVAKMPDEISFYEPALAFDGGPFGVGIIMRLLKEAQPFLRRGSWLAFEVGLGQAPMFIKHLDKMSFFSEVASLQDEQGSVRVILAQC